MYFNFEECLVYHDLGCSSITFIRSEDYETLMQYMRWILEFPYEPFNETILILL